MHRWCIGERARLECGKSWVQTKDYKIDICCFSAKHTAYSIKEKEQRLVGLESG